MKYQRFEDLPVWQAGMDLAERIEALAIAGAFQSKGDLCNQVCRASLSVPTNIAEGFESGTTAQLLTSLYIARGSAGEVRSLLRYADRLLDARLRSAGIAATTPSLSPNPSPDQKPPGIKSEISNLKSQISDSGGQLSGSRSQVSNLKSQISNFKSEVAALITLAESCSRQIRGWADSLQNTDIKGQRYLTEKERQVYENDHRAKSFMKQVDDVVRRRLGSKDKPS